MSKLSTIPPKSTLIFVRTADTFKKFACLNMQSLLKSFQNLLFLSAPRTALKSLHV